MVQAHPVTLQPQTRVAPASAEACQISGTATRERGLSVGTSLGTHESCCRRSTATEEGEGCANVDVMPLHAGARPVLCKPHQLTRPGLRSSSLSALLGWLMLTCFPVSPKS